MSFSRSAYAKSCNGFVPRRLMSKDWRWFCPPRASAKNWRWSRPSRQCFKKGRWPRLSCHLPRPADTTTPGLPLLTLSSARRLSEAHMDTTPLLCVLKPWLTYASIQRRLLPFFLHRMNQGLVEFFVDGIAVDIVYWTRYNSTSHQVGCLPVIFRMPCLQYIRD